MITRTVTADEAISLAFDPERDSLGRSSREHPAKDSWDARAGFNGCIELARQGYPAGTARLRQRLETLAPSMRENLRPRAVWDVAGSQVDVGRYLAGEPDCMIQVRRSRRQSLVLRIGIERAVSYGTTADDIEATGASALAVVERLRTVGIAAELYATFTLDNRHKANAETYQLQVKIQDASRPIDMDVLSFWTIHPGALRRLAFGVFEQEPADVRRAFGFHTLGNYAFPTTCDDGFDEYAPARKDQVEEWIADVITRRAGR